MYNLAIRPTKSSQQETDALASVLRIDSRIKNGRVCEVFSSRSSCSTPYYFSQKQLEKTTFNCAL
jgi:hypothetical protein